MRMHRCKSWPGFLTLGFFLILLSGLAIGADLGGLPQNWNPRNLAEIESPPSNTLTFAVLGDTKDGYKTLGRLFRQMNREGDLAFAMYLGDMVARGTVANYRIFFREIWRNLRIPLLGVIGNHELNGNGGGLYREIWGPPYYSFQVKGNYFIVLDDAESEDLNPSQMHWLERELQKAQGSQTRLVFMHVPLFDPRGGRHHHCLPPAVATPLLELFNKHRRGRGPFIRRRPEAFFLSLPEGFSHRGEAADSGAASQGGAAARGGSIPTPGLGRRGAVKSMVVVRVMHPALTLSNQQCRARLTRHFWCVRRTLHLNFTGQEKSSDRLIL
jgi:hypothetical protein